MNTALVISQNNALPSLTQCFINVSFPFSPSLFLTERCWGGTEREKERQLQYCFIAPKASLKQMGTGGLNQHFYAG